MSAQHLAKGSKQPPKVDGKLRLYSMEFCPFAQRVRLILKVKGVPHDIVNVQLYKNQPEWIFDLHPEGKVPALDTGSQVVTESLDISNFLDEQYPEPPLYTKDAQKREQDKSLMNDFNETMKLFFKAKYNEDKQSYSEHMQNILPRVQSLESELGKRGVYFGGDKPGMVDYMLWPWAERAPIIGTIYGEIPSAKELPRIYSWCKAMRTQKAVQETETSPERHYKLYLQYIAGPEAINYDLV